ncbi:MAG: flagellar hook-associated protein FlgK [Planctomycetaceae bacterium]|nr:flagellar hook-associated protein FlgK [Planctomycetaceae bacterium]
MLNFNAGLSALRSSQVAMDVIGNNIANANTPGYHRQSVQHVQSAPLYDGDFWRGTGVDVSRINQIASANVELALTANIADTGNVQQARRIASQIENSLLPSAGSIHQRFQQFFDNFNSLQSEPENASQQRIVASTSQNLAGEFNAISGEFQELKVATRQDIEFSIRQVNQQLSALSELNQQISNAQAIGQNPNSLLDSHQQLVNDIAQTIDIKAVPESRGFTYQFAQSRVLISQSTFQLEANFQSDGSVEIREQSGQIALDLGAGSLAAMQHSLNDVIPEYESQISELASALITSVDHVQATGVSQYGPLHSVTSHRTVSDTEIPLAEAGLPFEIKEGELYITVHDELTNQRTQHQVLIDPSSLSLTELAKEISQVPHVQAVADPNTNQLTVVSEPGYGFDFAGQLPTEADRLTITGDAGISFHGVYTGAENQELGFEILDTGQVGGPADLRVRVTDQAGNEVGEYQLGSGYEPGSIIDLGDGLQISFASGSLNAGDTFSVFAVNNSDTSGTLVGLGLNSFFEGSNASDIRLSSDVSNDPSRISSGRSDDSADGSNAKRILELRDMALVNGELSLEDHLDRTTTSIAIEVNVLNDLETDLVSFQNILSRERESISGVDPNEEMIEMLKYQRSFQAAVRVITTIDETLSELMNIIR